MSADGIVNIDILLGKKQEFLNDIQHIDQLLAKLGSLTGEKMDASFSDQAKGLKNEAKATKEKVDETFNKPVKFKLKADNNEANKEITSTTDFLKGIPKEKLTKLKADNTQAVLKFRNTKKQVEETPKEKKITFRAVMDGFKKSMSGMNKTLDETERHSSRLKDIIMGTVAGDLITGGIDKITESLKEAFNESIEYDKEQQVMVARWTTLTGNADKSKDMVKTINDLSVATGQAADVVDELEQGFYHLHSNKEESDNLTKSMLNMADAVGLSKEQINAVTQDMVHGLSTGRLSIGELNQISNYFPMFGEALLDYKKKVSGNSEMTMADLRKLASQGKISADEVEKVFNELGQDKYGEAAENMLKTMTGMERTIKARVPALLGAFMKPIMTAKNPFYESVSKWVSDKKTEEEFTKLGNSAQKGIDAVVHAFSTLGAPNSIFNSVNKLIDNMSGGLQKFGDYVVAHKDNISGIMINSKYILGIVADTAWGTFKDILSDIAGFLGDTDDKGNKAKDPLKEIDAILIDIANNKTGIENFTKALMAMWATKKIFGFISAVKEAKQVLMELKAVELITGDGGLLNFKGFKLGKGAKAAEELGEGAEAAKAATKFGKVGELAAGGLKTAGRGIAGLDVLMSLTELIGMNKHNAGKKVGAAAGSLGGVAAGGSLGATVGTMILPGIGTAVGGALGAAGGALGGTALGKKIGGAIQSGLKTKGPGIKKTIGEFFSGKLGWEQSIGKTAGKAVSGIKQGFSGAKKTISGVFSSIGKTLTKVFSPVKKFFSSFSKMISKAFTGIKRTVSGVFTSIGKAISQWGKSIKRTLSPIAEVIVHVFKTAFWLIYGPIRLVFEGIEGLIKKFVKWISPYLSNAWNRIKKTAKKVWTSISNVFSSFTKTVKKVLKALGTFIDDVWKGIKKKAKTAWSIIKKHIVDPVKEAFEGVKKYLGKLWDHIQVIFERLGKYVRSKWDKVKHDIIAPIESALEPVEKAATSIFRSIEKWFGKIWTKVSNVFGDIIDAATSLPQKIGTAFSKGVHWITSGFKDIANTMISWIANGVNGVLHGINWVLKKVHAPKDVLWDDWKPKKFAQGTNGKTAESQLAVINDAPGNDYQEIILHPDGKARVYEGRDRLTYLPKGSEVLEGSKSKDLMKMLPFPKYAEGTGKGILSSMWEKAKDVGEDIADFVEHPQDLLMSAVKKFTNLKGAASPYLDIAKGGVSYLIDKVKDWFSDMVKNFSDSGGSGSRGQFLKTAEAQGDKPYVWGAEGPNAFDCSGLVKWALAQVGISFPHYSGDQFSMTQPVSESDAKPGDLAFYGPGGDEHVGIVTGKNKMFAAQSPSSHPNIGPDSIHNGLPFSGIHRIRQLTDGSGSANNPAGTGVNRWIPMIKQAARTMHASLSDTMLHTILGLIQGESGGNASVNQQIIDVNSSNGSGGAKGLIQFIQSTFDAYKMPGHGNIYSGYDQLLALFNDSNWQTDIHPYGGWGPSGRRRFANGGWANQASIFGEVPGQPEVAINPKRDSADQFINEAIEARAKEAPNSLSAKIANILHSAKQGVQSVLPECHVSGQAVKNILESGETSSNGDLVVIVELDNGEIFKAQYPLHKAMEAHELVIEQSKAGVV